MNPPASSDPAHLEDIPGLYTGLYSARQFDAWRRLFADTAQVIRIDRDGRQVAMPIDRALDIYRRHAQGCREFREEWHAVDVRREGLLAFIRADYRLTTEREIREGRDLLTLACDAGAWKIVCLAYEQTRHVVRPDAVNPDSGGKTALPGARRRNITFDIIESARRTPEAPALLHGAQTIAYRELDELVWRYARHLHRSGARAGDVIGVTCADELELVLAMLAITRLGASVFSLPRSYTPFQRREMAARAGVRLLATDRPGLYAAGIPVIPLDRRALPPGPGAPDAGLLDEFPAACWLLITGSGSTGEPKLIPVTHAQAAARAERAASLLDLGAADRVAPLSHFDFSHAKFRLHETLAAGAACLIDLWREADPLGVLQRQSISVVFSTVFHAEKLLESLPPGTASALPGVRVFEVTSSTVSDDLRQRIRRGLCETLHVRYGINEAGPVAIARPPEVFSVPGTVGRIGAEGDVRIVDRRFDGLPIDTVGLVCIRGAGVVDGYACNPEATRRSFRDGWFLPGDLGKLTAAGDLIYYGRADHMMIMNGMNLYPAEIERVLGAHPAVRDVAVMPLRHRVHQDLPVAAVALVPGMQATEAELMDHARERLGIRAPQRILILERMPRTHEGKLIRRELSALLIDFLGAG